MSFSTAISNSWMKGWCGRRSFTTVAWGPVNGCPIFLPVGVLEYPPVVEEAKKNCNSLCHLLKIAIIVQLSSCLSCFWTSWIWWWSRMLIANIDRSMSQFRGYIERLWRWFIIEFGAEARSFSWRYERGSNSLFAQIWDIYLFESRKLNLWVLLPRCCWPFWLSAFYRPWHWALFWTLGFLEGWNVSHVESMALGFLLFLHTRW